MPVQTSVAGILRPTVLAVRRLAHRSQDTSNTRRQTTSEHVNAQKLLRLCELLRPADTATRHKSGAAMGVAESDRAEAQSSSERLTRVEQRARRQLPTREDRHTRTRDGLLQARVENTPRGGRKPTRSRRTTAPKGTRRRTVDRSVLEPAPLRHRTTLLPGRKRSLAINFDTTWSAANSRW